jgi:hypothetical protein
MMSNTKSKRKTCGWELPPSPATKKQRQVCYKFGWGNRQLVKGLTKDEAEAVISIMVAVSERIKNGTYDVGKE